MKRLLNLCLLVLLVSCSVKHKKADSKLLTDQNLLHNNMQQLTKVIILDVFSPPVSSRIYSYTSLAAYEALRFQKPALKSIVKELKGFSAMPVPDKRKNYNYLLSATKAFFTVAKKITFSKDTLVNYENIVYDDYKSLLDKDTYDSSINFGEAVGNAILERTKIDNYKETRGMPKFLGSDEDGKWRPTPSDYLDALEPSWGLILPFTLDSAAEIKCPLPPAFNLEKNSTFYKNAYEVYQIGIHLTEEQKLTAKYWDDNSFVIEHSGHLMFGNKKITPVGHWIGITGIACKMKNKDAAETARIYALTSISMFDVIITCWREKYIHNVIRPVTIINESFDRNWQSFLQTPPFPEHSSGHSGISAAASTILTKFFGNHFAFEDTSEVAYIGMRRYFPSFGFAAKQAAISRVYGGIHYRSGMEAGIVQGEEVANLVIERFFKDSGTKQKNDVVTK